MIRHPFVLAFGKMSIWHCTVLVLCAVLVLCVVLGLALALCTYSQLFMLGSTGTRVERLALECRQLTVHRG